MLHPFQLVSSWIININLKNWVYINPQFWTLDELKPDLNNGDYFNLQRGLFLQGLFNRFSPNKFEKPYALFNISVF